MNEHLQPEAAKIVADIERGKSFLRNVVTGERLQPATKCHPPVSERVINQHQCFMTRREMLAAVVVHIRLLSIALDQHLQTDLSSLDIGEVEETAYRVLQLVQGVKAAQIAEAQLSEAAAKEAEAGANFGGKLHMTCELTVGHPDGTTS